MKKIALLLAGGIFLAAVCGYTVFWFVLAGRITDEVNELASWAEENEIIVSGSFSPVSGFPRPHEISFAGTLEKDGAILTIPRLEARGFPVTGATIDISVPQGFEVAGVENPELWTVDFLSLAFIVPPFVPYEFTVEELRAWRQAGGQIDVPAFALSKNALNLEGKGTLGVDEDLQPAGKLQARISGYAAFLGYLQGEGLIESKEALITGAVLNGLSRQDPDTGERFIAAEVVAQNNTLLLGPLALLTFPRIDWDYNIPGF